jgi:hypothetical protein
MSFNTKIAYFVIFFTAFTTASIMLSTLIFWDYVAEENNKECQCISEKIQIEEGYYNPFTQKVEYMCIERKIAEEWVKK